MCNGYNIWSEKESYGCHTFVCEIVEGEENKLTTLSTWNSNESNTIFRQHLCQLGQLQRAILSRDHTEDDEIFCTALLIHLRVQLNFKVHVILGIHRNSKYYKVVNMRRVNGSRGR